MRLLVVVLFLSLWAGVKGQELPYEIEVYDINKELVRFGNEVYPNDNGYYVKNAAGCLYYAAGTGDLVEVVCDSVAVTRVVQTQEGQYVEARYTDQNRCLLYYLANDNPREPVLLHESTAIISLYGARNDGSVIFKDGADEGLYHISAINPKPTLLVEGSELSYGPAVLRNYEDYSVVVTRFEVVITDGTREGTHLLLKETVEVGQAYSPLYGVTDFVLSDQLLYFTTNEKVFRYPLDGLGRAQEIKNPSFGGGIRYITGLQATTWGVVYGVYDEAREAHLLTIKHDESVASYLREGANGTIIKPYLLDGFFALAGGLLIHQAIPGGSQVILIDEPMGDSEILFEKVLMQGFSLSNVTRTASGLNVIVVKKYYTQYAYLYNPSTESVESMSDNAGPIAGFLPLLETDRWVYFTEGDSEPFFYKGELAPLFRLDQVTKDITRVYDPIQLNQILRDTAANVSRMIGQLEDGSTRLITIDGNTEEVTSIRLDIPANDVDGSVYKLWQVGNELFYIYSSASQADTFYSLKLANGVVTQRGELFPVSRSGKVSGVFAGDNELHVVTIDEYGIIKNGDYTKITDDYRGRVFSTYIGKINGEAYFQSNHTVHNARSNERISVDNLLGLRNIQLSEGVAVGNRLYFLVGAQPAYGRAVNKVGLAVYDPARRSMSIVSTLRPALEGYDRAWTQLKELGGKLYYPLPGEDGRPALYVYDPEIGEQMVEGADGFSALRSLVSSSDNLFYQGDTSDDDQVVVQLQPPSGLSAVLDLLPDELLLTVARFGDERLIITNQRVAELETGQVRYVAQGGQLIQGVKELTDELVLTLYDDRKIGLYAYRGVSGSLAVIDTNIARNSFISVAQGQAVLGNQLLYAKRSGDLATYKLYDGVVNQLYTVDITPYNETFSGLVNTSPTLFLGFAAAAEGNFYFVAKDPVANVEVHSFRPKYTAAVSGLVYLDANGNGAYDEGERSLPNQRIVARGRNDLTTYTDSTGRYRLYPEQGVSYTLEVAASDCYTSTHASYTFTATSDTALIYDIALTQTASTTTLTPA